MTEENICLTCQHNNKHITCPAKQGVVFEEGATVFAIACVWYERKDTAHD